MSMFLYPYNTNSEGAKGLANSLGIKRIKQEGSRFVGSKDKLVINWGCSRMNPEVSKSEVINNPEAVRIASNKLEFFRACKESLFLPPYTERIDNARMSIEDGYQVVCRTILNGHSGAGIVLASTVDELVDAPLYVRYIPKKSEYRVHVFKGQVIDVQRKARRKDIPDDQVNWKIRNHDNGFIYSRNEELGAVPARVLTAAMDVMGRVGLDFGAVDVIHNDKRGHAYALEINTAPGLSGETLERYTHLFNSLNKHHQKDKANFAYNALKDYFDVYAGFANGIPAPEPQ